MPGNNSIIGALAVDLSLDSASFESGAQRAAKASGGLEGALGGLGRAGLGMVGGLLAGTSAVALFTAGLEKAGQTAQELDDLSAAATKIGITSEALQELRHAAEANDIPVDKLDAGLQSLNGTLGALRLRIGDKKIRQAFDELDIPQASLGKMKDASDLLPVLADRISKIGNEADQVLIAKKLGIEDLLPLLQQGAQGLEELRQKARELGLVLDEQTVNRVADMNEQLRVADERSKAAGRRLSTELVPVLVQIKGAAADAAGALASMFSWFNRHQGAEFEIESGLKRAQAARQRADTIRNGSTVAAMLAGNVSGLEALQPGWREIAAQRQEKEAARIDADNEKRSLAAQRRAAEAAANAAAEATASAGGFKLTAPAKAKKKDDAPGPFVESFHTYVSQGGLADVKEAVRPAIEGTIVDVAGNVAKALQKNRAQISEQWRWTIEGGVQAFAYGGAKGLWAYMADQFRDRLVQRLTDGLMRVVDQLLDAGSAAGGSGGNGDLIATAFNFGRKVLGFAGGGSFNVGGSGGVDSQLVQFRASPDERVTITKPGQAMGGVQQTFILHAEGAVLAESLVDRMREIGFAAAVHGEIGGAARAQANLMRRGRQRLG